MCPIYFSDQAPLWTDIVQAFGVLLGTPLIVWNIIQLFKKDKKREKQVEALSSMAIQMKNQLDEFAEQTRIMSETLLIEKQRRMREIQPKFQIDECKFVLKWLRVELKLVNLGGTAIWLGAENTEERVKFTFSQPEVGSLIAPDESIIVACIYPDKGDQETYNFWFQIRFRDFNKDIYTQYCSATHDSFHEESFSIANPVLAVKTL